MFRIPLRKTVDKELSQIIVSKIKGCESFLDPIVLDQTYADAQELQALRHKATRTDSELSDLQQYFAALEQISVKFDLADEKFAWSNCLGVSDSMVQGQGIWFEFLNVAFNLGAKYTYGSPSESEAFQKAAGFFEFAELNILPKLHGDPPAELTSQVLLLLRDICLTHAYELEHIGFDSKWIASEQYRLIWDLLRRAPCSLYLLETGFEPHIKKLQSQASFFWGESLSKSRKRNDQLLAKAALLKCCELCEDTDELSIAANRILSQPLGRRKNSQLSQLEGDYEFESNDYFSEKYSGLPASWPELNTPTKTYFKDMLPLSVISLPQLLQHKLSSLVQKKLIEPLLSYNQKIRQLSVKFSLPSGVEILQQPTRVPASLLALGSELTKQGGTDFLKRQLQSCHDLAVDIENQICVLDLTSEDTLVVQRSVTDAKAALEALEERLEKVKFLLRILEKGEDALRSFLGISAAKARGPEKRSKPAFLARVEINHKANIEKCHHRDLRMKSIIQKSRAYDFQSMIVEKYAANPSAMNQVDLDWLLEPILLSFNDDFEYLTKEKREYSHQMESLIELHKQFKALGRQSLVSSKTFNAVDALSAAWSYWIDTSLEVERLLRSLRCLNDVCAAQPIRTTDSASKAISSSRTNSRGFHWQPGMSIIFA